MRNLSVEQCVSAFLEAWQETTVRLADEVKAGNTSSLKEIEILPGLQTANVVSRIGSSHLSDAARALLMREKLSGKLTLKTARKAIVEGLAAHIPKAMRTRNLSEHAIIAKATASLRAHKRDNGLYIFPVVFADRAKTTDFCIGAARIVSKETLETEMADAWAQLEAERRDEITARLVLDWRRHSSGYDHYITVKIEDYESDMAWPAARDAAEALLNIIRMYFGYAAMDDVRIGDGFVWQDRRSSIWLSNDGQICLSSTYGGNGSHLEDGWHKRFGEHLSKFALLLASAVSWHTQNDGLPDPMLERLIYFNRLLAEAYCEPHHPIRLVRLVSALEAFSMIGSIDKAHNLAHRCAAAGGWSDPHEYCKIYDAVREAYHWRNAVVHGDAPRGSDVLRAFCKVERYMLGIYLGMLSLHAGIANAVRPRSISRLRREFTERIDLFFWAPSLATYAVGMCRQQHAASS